MTFADINNSGITTWAWSPASALNNSTIAKQVASVDRETLITLTASTPEGCSATTAINLKVYKGPEIYVPTAFTPMEMEKMIISKHFPWE